MRLPVKARELPGRVTAGAYILHAGLDKWHADEARDGAIHGMAAGAFPFLRRVPPDRFVRALAASEIAIGGALLAPVVPAAVAGTALTGFAGGLLAMYARTEALRKPGSIWPSRAGTAVSKDVWMLGIGLDLVLGAITEHREDGRAGR